MLTLHNSKQYDYQNGMIYNDYTGSDFIQRKI